MERERIPSKPVGNVSRMLGRILSQVGLHKVKFRVFYIISEEGLPKAKECTRQYLPKENEACASLIAELTPNDMEKGELGYYRFI